MGGRRTRESMHHRVPVIVALAETERARGRRCERIATFARNSTDFDVASSLFIMGSNGITCDFWWRERMVERAHAPTNK